MEYLELLKKRYSVRKYTDAEVEEEKLEGILEAARLAPTACNLQAFKVVVFRTREHEEDLKKVYSRPFFTQAPLVIGVFSFPEDTWVRSDGKNYADVDAAIVMDHIILAATALGLGTCWVGAFDPQAARKAAGLSLGWEAVAFTPVGYSAASQPEKRRKSLDEIVQYS